MWQTPRQSEALPSIRDSARFKPIRLLGLVWFHRRKLRDPIRRANEGAEGHDRSNLALKFLNWHLPILRGDFEIRADCDLAAEALVFGAVVSN